MISKNLGTQFQPRGHLTFSSLFITAICLSMFWTGRANAIGFSVGVNFSDGDISASGFIPPDTMGGVGPNHVAVMINGLYRVYDKTGVQQQSKSLNSFWTSAGVTPAGSFAFDPRILYDSASGRWFACSVDNAAGANNFLVAVSATSDPAGTWSGFTIDADADNGKWADYPTMGMNNSILAISANMFPINSGSTTTSQLVIPKADLLLGAPTVANRTLFQNTNNIGFSVQPIVDMTGGSQPLPLISSYNKPGGTLKTSTIGGTPAAPTLNTGGGFISVIARSSPPTIDQQGASQNIDAGDNRFTGNSIMQQTPGRPNKSIWATHCVNVNGRAAIEWYEINAATNAILQSGLISDASLGFNYPTLAVNANGVVVIGFSGASPTTYMSTYAVVGETVSGVTTFSPITLTKAGVNEYQRLDSSTRNRWGDYSATVVDPSNPLSFWTFQEFASGLNDWQIQVTQLVLVPEPNSCLLLALAMIGAVGLRPKRQLQ